MRDQITDPEQSLEFRNFARCCKSGMRLFDIGASYGVFSLTAAHFGGTAVAVDPSPVATRLIRVQIQESGLLHFLDGRVALGKVFDPEIRSAISQCEEGIVPAERLGRDSNGRKYNR